MGGKTNAVTYDYVSGNLKNINFIHNTFVESGMINLSRGASGNTWANNIFLKSTGDIFSGSMLGIKWTNNLYWGKNLIEVAGITRTDPKLVINADGYFGLSSNSPAINAGDPNYPAVLDIPDIDDDPQIRYDGSTQLRNSRKDIGSDEYVNSVRINRPLSLSDVGPVYLGGPSSAKNQP